MKFLRQLLAILRVNLSGVPQRLGSALTIVVGVTCAVGTLVSMLAMGTGAREQQSANIRADRVVLTTRGTRMGEGNISRQEAAVVLGLPGVRKDATGDPIVVFQAMAPVEGRGRATGKRIFFPLIGATSKMTELAPERRFTAGRPFRPAARAGREQCLRSPLCRLRDRRSTPYSRQRLDCRRPLRRGACSTMCCVRRCGHPHDHIRPQHILLGCVDAAVTG